MSKFIEIRNIDFYQITIDNIPYKIEKMEMIDDKAHLIYEPMNENITSIKVIKDKTKRIYKLKEELKCQE